MINFRYPRPSIAFFLSFRYLFLAITTICFFTASAQYESLLNKKYVERAPELWKIGDSIFFQPDSTQAFRMAKNLIEFAIQHNDESLRLETELNQLHYLLAKYPRQEHRIMESFTTIIQQTVQSKSLEVELKARFLLARYYWNQMENYELALEEYNKVDRLLTTITFKEYPEKIQLLYYIGRAYFIFKDYPKAIQYFRQVSGMKPVVDFQKYAYAHSVNNMAIAYQELGHLDSSDHYLRLLYQYSVNQKDSTWMGIVKGNLGHNEYLRGRYEQAIPLMKLCIDRAIIDRDWGLASGSLMPLANIYFKQNRIAEAIATTLQARDFVERSGQYNRYQYLYPLLSKMYACKGNPELSGQYIDSALFVKDSLNRKFSGRLLARVLQKDAIIGQRAKLAELESNKQLLTLKFYAFLVLAFILFVVIAYIYRSKRWQHKQQQHLKDLQLKEKEKELLSARAQLIDFTQHLAEKNELISQLEEKKGNSKLLEELEQSIILTGKDWGRFRDLFEQAHPGWLQRLTEKIPGITPSEIRLMALSKLNFSNKEMAAALGVTPQAIRVTWHRLRKKQNLPEDGTIEELLNII